MKICVTGSTGLIGSVLVRHLSGQSHEVVCLARGSGDQPAQWDPETGHIDAQSIGGADALIHLAGESIMGRWNRAKKERIRRSRAHGTGALCQTLAGLDRPPAVLICASAVGFYGDRGSETLDEQSEGGAGFLSEVCRQWEASTQPAAAAGVRVIHLRLGMVLSRRGGALAKMLPPFRLGLGGRVGSGEQYWSWIAIDDVVAAVLHAIRTDSLSGPVNAVSPNPVTSRTFTQQLGHFLRRPTILPLPAFAARLALGELADALLLASARVIPKRLTDSGYSFQYATLQQALQHLLGTS